jgi:hypothetical protein
MNSAIPEDCRWPALRDLQSLELTRRYSAVLEKLSHFSVQGCAEPAVLIGGREYQEEQFRLRS